MDNQHHLHAEDLNSHNAITSTDASLYQANSCVLSAKLTVVLKSIANQQQKANNLSRSVLPAGRSAP